MYCFIGFHFYVLYEGLAPSEIVARYPELEGVWEGNETTLYGRPLSYYRQLNNLNLFKAWSTVTVPVLNVYGENDFIMGIEDQQKLVSDINKAHPGLAQLVVVPTWDIPTAFSLQKKMLTLAIILVGMPARQVLKRLGFLLIWLSQKNDRGNC